MTAEALHAWDVTPREAVALQNQLSSRVVLADDFGALRTIAGCDMAIDETKEKGVAGIIVYSFPDLKEIERRTAVKKLTFPYVPGLLSFREAPVLVELFASLRHDPDLVIFDGQGIAHPRGVGIATHMGLWLNKPAIGCAKSRLFGVYEEPARERGSAVPLLAPRGGRIGTVLRTRDGCRPVFISPGHRVSIESAEKIVAQCLDGYRIPKPTREADRYVGNAKREMLE